MTSIDGMDDVRALTDTEFAGLLDKLLPVEWPVPAERIRPLIDGWDWPVLWAADDGASYEADPGFRLDNKAPSLFHGFEGWLSEIVVSTSDYVTEPTDASHAALRDAFGRHVATTRQRVGEPVRRSPGEVASVTWDLASGARLEVACGPASCWVEIVSPEEARERRESGD